MHDKMIKNTGLACKNTHNKLLNAIFSCWMSGKWQMAEWNFRMEVHSRVEVQSGSESEWNIYVELNGPYMGFRISLCSLHAIGQHAVIDLATL